MDALLKVLAEVRPAAEDHIAVLERIQKFFRFIKWALVVNSMDFDNGITVPHDIILPAIIRLTERPIFIIPLS